MSQEDIRCIRVLTISRGCTTSVEMTPALSPAIDSTAAGERPAWRVCDIYEAGIFLDTRGAQEKKRTASIGNLSPHVVGAEG